jgi:heat-inducible transcriptional repressor
MARLEDLGYFTHPHTSAGRVPTDKGYRYFVERLLQTTNLPLAERRTIAHQFQQVRQQVEEWMPLAASVLARTTNSAALVTAPKAPHARFRYLQLISTQSRSVLLVLVLQGGLINQQMLMLPESMGQETLSEAADRLNQLCAGLSNEEIAPRIAALPNFEAEVARLVVDLMQRGESSATGDVYHDGLSTLLQKPEFVESTQTQGVLRVIEEKSFLDAVLVDALGPTVGSIRVMIGEEGQFDELRACSLILSRYGVSGLATGALGILGPTRMGYGRAISAVRFVTDVLSDLVHETFAPDEAPFPPANRRSR